ncbi:MAG: DNA-processing protein DprA [Candidatus Nanopelagicales bacterium]
MDEERLATVAIACLVEPGTGEVATEVGEFGAVEALARLQRNGRLLRGVAGRLEPAEVPAMLAEMERRGIRVILPGDPEFPTQLLDLPEPPVALWVRGPLDLRATALRSVAVVGARACTPYGERVTAALSAGLAGEGWAVVSGAAFGIDAAAHRSVLSVDGPTVAVLACGVDVAYPRAHDALISRIGDAGLVVSELPPGSAPLRFRFLARNRLIAGLTRGTVVVEAARRSGAIATANRAMALGRAVMGVPGPVTSMASAGVNRLLFEQTARAVSDWVDVVTVLLDGSASHGPEGVQLPMVDPDLPVEAARVLGMLPGRVGQSVEAVAARAGIAPAECLGLLGLLELAGLARRTAAGWKRSG